jgi:hypothetical protein
MFSNIIRKSYLNPLFFVAVFFASILLSILLSTGSVNAADTSQFKAGRIIDDTVFTNYNSMSAAQIQQFLNNKNSTCLKNFRSLSLHDDNGDGTVQDSTTEKYGPGTMSAAELIATAARIYRINPQVILVTLQKEQGLVTRSDCPDWRYNTALGYGCPDTADCDGSAFGFTRQIDYAAYHFRGYFDDTLPSVPYGIGAQTIAYNPSGSCGSSVVNIANRATASLYSYTPYQPNAGALAAGYGEAPCGAYGNRNFFLYFNDWFGPTTDQVSYVQAEGSSAQYVLYDGKKQALTYDGLLAWGINRLPLTVMSVDALNTIPNTATPLTRLATVTGTNSMVFADSSTYYDINSGTMAVWGNFKNAQMSSVGWPVIGITGFGGSLPFAATKPNDTHQYIMESGTLYPASSPSVIRAWGVTNSITLSQLYSQDLPIGQQISQNLVSSGGNSYMLSNSQAYRVDPKVSNLLPGWQPLPISSGSLGRYSQMGNLSHLIKSDKSGVIFAIDGAQKRPINSFDIFDALRNSNSYESRLSNDAIDLIPTGNPITSSILKPQGTNTYYVATQKSLQQIPDRLAAEYNASLTASTVTSAFTDIFPKQPNNVTQFIKSPSSSLVYFVSQGKKIPINRYDVMVLLNGQDSTTLVNDSALEALPTSTTQMTPVLASGQTGAALIDKSTAFVASDQQILGRWNSPQATQVSQATYDYFTSSHQTLSQHVQTQNGEFCNIDSNRYCAEQHGMIFVWKLLDGVIHPSDQLLSYLNIYRAGRLTQFVSSPNGQQFSSNVFLMADGALSYISTPSALANLGYSGMLTKISPSSINATNSGSVANGYLLKDESNNVWVLDNGIKRPVTADLSSNWTGASATPSNVSNWFVSLYPQGPALSRSITNSSVSAIFGMDNGQKRGITSYSKYLQSWNPYVNVSVPLLNLLPAGADF